MLKLLKYEMIQSYRQYLLTFAIFLILCCLAPWLPSYLGGIVTTLLIFAFLGISCAIFINVITNFNRSMYKRPGYLTLTLPVSTEKLVGAKYLGSLIWVFVGSLILSLGFVILILLVGGVQFNMLFDAFGQMINIFGKNWDYIMFSLLESIALTSLMILSFFFVITLTKTKYIPKYKTIIGIALYVVGVYLVGSFFTSALIENVLSGLSYNASMAFLIISSTLGSILFYYLTVYLINHKIEVE